MRRVLRTAVLVVALVLAVANAPLARAAGITATSVATGLNNPAAFTFASDGSIFYGERLTGQIRVINPTRTSNTLFFTIPNVLTTSEQGLDGIALHPSYPSQPYVYAYVTRNVNGAATNQIVRITASGGTGSNMKAMFSEPAITYHNGGRIRFGPDGQLYVVVGDRGDPANSQNLASPAGKILRMGAFGGIPSSNPFPNSKVWAFGIRNSFGFNFDPQTKKLWETENGPACNDEINLIQAGGNYAWGPHQTCATPPTPPNNTNQDGSNRILPKKFYGSVIAPTGGVFCQACGLGTAASGRFFFGTYDTDQIHKLTLDSARTAIVGDAIVLTHSEAVLSMEAAPDRTLYFSDSSAIYRLALG